MSPPPASSSPSSSFCKSFSRRRRTGGIPTCTAPDRSTPFPRGTSGYAPSALPIRISRQSRVEQLHTLPRHHHGKSAHMGPGSLASRRLVRLYAWRRAGEGGERDFQAFKVNTVCHQYTLSTLAAPGGGSGGRGSRGSNSNSRYTAL